VERLPLAPPLLPDEALSSWVARIAARYDLSANALARHVLPGDPSVDGMLRHIDERPCPPLELVFAGAVGRPDMDFAGHRVPDLTIHSEAAWPRQHSAWCPVCVFEDVAARNEVHARRHWGLGCYLLCSLHGCLLISECPRCWNPVGYQPVNGRLRFWCDRCEGMADNALEPSRIPFWPFGLPQQSQRCRTVSLTDEARPLLLRLQRTRLAALAGRHVRASWTRQLRRSRVTETLRTLCFIMLGPLWEDAERPGLVQHESADTAHIPDDWTLGSLPAFIAAPALLASVTLLAAESDVRLTGITWNRQALREGEKAEISAETLPWHLSAYDTRLACTLLRPGDEPFALLLSALRNDTKGLGATSERRRRRYGIGALQRQHRLTAMARRSETDAARDERLQRRQAWPRADRYGLERLIPGVQAQATARAPQTPLKAAVAVLATIGSNGDDDDVVHRTGWCGTRMESRYIQSWITQHRDCSAQILVAALVEAVDQARAADRGLVLPDLVPKPIAYPWTEEASG
jgi:hypothetical protein